MTAEVDNDVDDIGGFLLSISLVSWASGFLISLAFGLFSSYNKVQTTRLSRVERKFEMVRDAMAAILSAFLTMVSCKAIQASPTWTIVALAVTGYGGSAFLDKVLRKKQKQFLDSLGEDSPP